MFFWNKLRDNRSKSRFGRPKVGRSAEAESVPGLIKLGRAEKTCRIQTVTGTAVILEFGNEPPPDLPQFFYLKTQSDRTFRRGRLIWQHRKQAGVEFITNWATSS